MNGESAKKKDGVLGQTRVIAVDCGSSQNLDIHLVLIHRCACMVKVWNTSADQRVPTLTTFFFQNYISRGRGVRGSKYH